MDPNGIVIICFGLGDQDMVGWIAEDIERSFSFPARIMEITTNLSSYYNPGRRQYNANEILKYLSEIAPEDAIKSVGLLKVDLFIPILTYIFGQAVLGGNSGIVSIYRLRNELYGLKQNYMLQVERFRKVVIHELGHTFGLIHCHIPDCIMRSSTYVEDIDQKGILFCPSCQEILEHKIQSSYPDISGPNL